MGTSTYRTVQGDAWDSIAYKLWGEECLAHKLIQNNTEYMDTLIFSAGVELIVPEVEAVVIEAALPAWRQV